MPPYSFPLPDTSAPTVHLASVIAFSTLMITGTTEEYRKTIDVLRVFFAIFGRWLMWVSPLVGL